MDPFRISAHVPEFNDIVAEMVRRSETARATIPTVTDIPYGPDPAETVDLFFPNGKRRDLPVHMFIHGGYWRMFSKRDYSYIAETVTRAGAIAIIVDYALMPKVRMATIVDQVRRAKGWVLDQIETHGGDPGRLTVSGHSAGAHLATTLFEGNGAPSKIRTALLLGGLYELKPLQNSFLHAEIAITDQEVVDFSPATHRFDRSVAVEVVVGAAETPPFHEQADRFAKYLGGQGLNVSRTNLPDTNHMSSVLQLGVRDTNAAKLLEKIIHR